MEDNPVVDAALTALTAAYVTPAPFLAETHAPGRRPQLAPPDDPPRQAPEGLVPTSGPGEPTS